jgi:hypothetical protein
MQVRPVQSAALWKRIFITGKVAVDHNRYRNPASMWVELSRVADTQLALALGLANRSVSCVPPQV